jgi:hypothetical protein
LKPLGEFIVRVANLAEAEGRVAKRHAVRLIGAALVWAAALLFLTAGGLAICGAIFLGLSELFPVAWALAFTALLPVAAGAGCVIAGYFLIKRGGQ